MVAAAFILAPVAVTPLLAVQARAAAATLVVGAVLGGEMTAALYAAGQYGRFSSWLIAVELVALLPAPRTLDMLGLARVRAIPAGWEIPGPFGLLLIVVLAPIALAAGFLDAMARHPRTAVVRAAVAATALTLAMDSAWWSVPIAAASIYRSDTPRAMRQTHGWGQMMQHGTRDDLLGRLTAEIGSATTTHPLRVAIDGPPAAGKTTLADELAVVLRAQGRDVIRATIDDFLFPRAQRYRRGQYSPEGCYFDAHDHDAMGRVLLDPLGPDGDRRFQTAVYHRETDTTLSLPITTAPADAVLLFDGVFLLRPELLDRWDLSIFMAVTFDRTLDRAQARGTALAGLAAGTTEIERSWRNRYIPSQQLYFAQDRPTDHADIIVNNDELQRPAWEVRTHRPR